MEYLVTKKARVWASVNGRISPDFPVAFVDKGKKVDGTKVSEYITSEAGSLDEPFIRLNGGRYILARNVKAIGKEYSSATGDVGGTVGSRMFFGGMIGGTAGFIIGQLASKSLTGKIAFPIVGLVAGIFLGKAIRPKDENSGFSNFSKFGMTNKSCLLSAGNAETGAGATYGCLVESPDGSTECVDCNMIKTSKINKLYKRRGNAQAQRHLCIGGYWQGSLATGHCYYPPRHGALY